MTKLLPEIDEADADLQSFADLYFSDAHPVHANLNIRIENISETEVIVHAAINDCFNEGFNGNHVHRGTLTLLLDSIFGLTLLSHLRELRPIATVNLKTDYLTPVNTGTDILCMASCFHVENNIARLRGSVKDATSGALLASATATFMTNTAGPPFSAGKKT